MIKLLQRTGLTSLSHLLSRRHISVFGHVARLDDGPAPSRPWNKWLNQLRNDSTRPIESSGGVLSTVDMVVQRRNGPRWLREHDDDDDEIH